MSDNNAVLQLLDVIKIQYENSTQTADKTRTFCAVSLRKRAKTVIESNGQRITLGDGSLTFVPANTPYFRQSLYDDMIVIHFNSSVILADTIITASDFDYNTMLEKFENALSIWNGHEVDKYYRTSALLYEIIAVFCKNINIFHYSEQMQKAVNYIKKNLRNPSLSVIDIAEHLNICPTTLRKLFKEETGHSPNQFIINTRLEKAVSMLNDGYYSVTQVADHLGFSDQKNFSTAFKKHFGYSPSKQRYNYNGKFG